MNAGNDADLALVAESCSHLKRLSTASQHFLSSIPIHRLVYVAGVLVLIPLVCGPSVARTPSQLKVTIRLGGGERTQVGDTSRAERTGGTRRAEPHRAV